MIPATVAAFRRACCESAGGVDERRFHEAFRFGDAPALADELAGLVMRGRKRATAGGGGRMSAPGRSQARIPERVAQRVVQ